MTHQFENNFLMYIFDCIDAVKNIERLSMFFIKSVLDGLRIK